MADLVIGRARPRIVFRTRPAPPTLAGIGDYTPEKLAADINQVIEELQARLKAEQTNGALSRLLDVELTRAHAFQSTNLSPNTLAVRVAALQRIRDETHLAYAKVPASAAPIARREAASQAAGDVLRWYAAVTGQVLRASNARAATVKDAAQALADAPKNLIGWLLESLGLPRWALPVAIVVVGLVVLQSATGALSGVGGALRAATKGGNHA
jgi:hypothetical protein